MECQQDTTATTATVDASQDARADFIQLCVLAGKEVAARSAQLEQMALSVQEDPSVSIDDLLGCAFLFSQLLKQTEQLSKAAHMVIRLGRLSCKVTDAALEAWDSGYPDVAEGKISSRPLEQSWKKMVAHGDALECQCPKGHSGGDVMSAMSLLALLSR